MKLKTANIALPAGKNEYFEWDDDLTGFALRLRRGAGGRVIRNWVIQYRSHGRQPRMTVGSAEKLTAAEARKAAKKLLAKVELGGDPQHDRRDRRERNEHTLRSVVTDYLDHKAGSIKPRSLELLRYYLLEGPHLKPLLSTPIDRITRKDVAARLLAADKNSGTPSAISLRSATSSLFSWAMSTGLVEANPVVGAFKPDTPKSRDRVLSGGELAAIWRGLADDDYAKVIKLLILTGCRRAEVGGMRWTEFDLDAGAWTLPKERSKNGLAHTLALTPSMRSIIDSVPRRERFDILWGYRNGFTSWVQGKQALDALLGLPHWTHHDVRRSVATGMADIGVQPHIIEEILNHKSGHKRGPAGIYNRSSYSNEVRRAMELWSDHVTALVEGRKSKIVQLERPAAMTVGY
jgi:integrase